MEFSQRHAAEAEPDPTEFSEMFGPEGTDEVKRSAREHWDDGGVGNTFVAVCDFMGWGLGKIVWGTGNLATGNYYETRSAGLAAYREGKISKDQFNELDNAAAGRAIASTVVFTALTMVTAGLAGPVLGAAAVSAGPCCTRASRTR